MLGLRKPNFKTKMIHFEKSHNAENCERGLFEIFSHPLCCKISKSLKGDPLETEKLSKEMLIFNSLIVPKKLKEETLWEVLTFVLLQNIK